MGQEQHHFPATNRSKVKPSVPRTRGYRPRHWETEPVRTIRVPPGPRRKPGKPRELTNKRRGVHSAREQGSQCFRPVATPEDIGTAPRLIPNSRQYRRYPGGDHTSRIVLVGPPRAVVWPTTPLRPKIPRGCAAPPSANLFLLPGGTS